MTEQDFLPFRDSGYWLWFIMPCDDHPSAVGAQLSGPVVTAGPVSFLP